MVFHAQGAQISRWKKPEMKTDKTLVWNKGNIKRIMFCQPWEIYVISILEFLRISQRDTYSALKMIGELGMIVPLTNGAGTLAAHPSSSFPRFDQERQQKDLGRPMTSKEKLKLKLKRLGQDQGHTREAIKKTDRGMSFSCGSTCPAGSWKNVVSKICFFLIS